MRVRVQQNGKVAARQFIGAVDLTVEQNLQLGWVIRHKAKDFDKLLQWIRPEIGPGDKGNKNCEDGIHHKQFEQTRLFNTRERINPHQHSRKWPQHADGGGDPKKEGGKTLRVLRSL